MQYSLELRALLGGQQRALAGPQRVLEGRYRLRRLRRVLGASSIHDGEEKLPVADTAMESSSWEGKSVAEVAILQMNEW